MNMICPHCGLQGKAEESLIGKKVRCPECQKVFRAEEFKNQADSEPAIEQPVTQEEENTTPPPTTKTVPPINDTTCPKCGFGFDEFFSDEGQELNICSVCGRKRPVSA